MSRTKNWTWETLKKDIDEGHRRFFEKRGINPNQAEGFLFGNGKDIIKKKQKDRTSPSSSCQSDRPK